MNNLFESEYLKLNKAQKEAVDAIDGPVMVIAGPGTGKTQILTLRIANILQKTDTEAENILALTFTEAGVANMRKRLVGMIGAQAYQTSIYTFHGFAEHIITHYPESFPRIIGSRPITDVDQVALVEKLIDRMTLEILRPYGDPHLYARDIVSSIAELKREGVSVDDFEKLLQEEEQNFRRIPDLYHEKGAHKGKMKGEYQKLERLIEKNKELGHMYREYEQELTNLKHYDFSDMIMEVLQALRAQPALLQMLQEEYQYILVDEHQDTNNAQNRILELLSNFHNNPNLFVVGDEKQAIFRFQGASLENFYYFRDLYPEAKCITLTENYRSTQTILDSAGSLLSGENSLSARAGHTETPIMVYPFSRQSSELYVIAHDIKKKIEQGIPPSEIAVLYRNNADAFPLASILEKIGVVYQIESDQDLFSNRDVVKLITILSAILNFGDSAVLARMLHIDIFNTEPLDIYRLIRSASDKKILSMFDMLADEKHLKGLSFENKESLTSAYQKFSGWVKSSHNLDLLTLTETVIRESGLLESMLVSDDGAERFASIATLFEEIKALVAKKPEATLQDFFVYIDTIRKHNLFIKKKKMSGGEGKVRLMTVHRSKGLEFEYVYIIHAYSGHFGDKRSVERLKLIPRIYLLSNKDVPFSDDDNADERRLFYVALTRAKKGITVSYASVSDDGREQLPSSFIEELKPELLSVVDTQELEKHALEDKDIIFREKIAPIVHSLKDKEFIAELFDKQGLSPTALNNYLDCPWKYFYQNLIRIPSAPTKHQAYGIAAHGALQDFFKMFRAEDIGCDFLLNSFEGYLNRQSLSSRELSELMSKGKESLRGWYDTHRGTWERNVLTEFRVSGVLLDDTIRLTGVLDKVEFIDDLVVNVVDYKTGKPKTRNELMGKTKNANGNYYRQLIFYKLLLEYFKDGFYNMQSGTIDFIEPEENGKYRKENFEISQEEVEELKETIRRCVSEILNLEFWDKRCDDKTCEFCGLRNLVK